MSRQRIDAITIHDDHAVLLYKSNVLRPDASDEWAPFVQMHVSQLGVDDPLTRNFEDAAIVEITIDRADDQFIGMGIVPEGRTGPGRLRIVGKFKV